MLEPSTFTLKLNMVPALTDTTLRRPQAFSQSQGVNGNSDVVRPPDDGRGLGFQAVPIED